MKRVLFLIGFGFSLSAFAANTVNNGGNLLPDEQIAPAKLQVIIDHAQKDLLSYLNFLSFEPPQDPVVKNFSSRLPSIAALLTSGVPIGRGFCKDEKGRRADGSAQLKSKTICIDPSRLQKKLSETSVWAQTMALIAHEYSHLIGYNEAEATALQKALVRDLRAYSKEQVLDHHRFFLTRLAYFSQSPSLEPHFQRYVTERDLIRDGTAGPIDSWSEQFLVKILTMPRLILDENFYHLTLFCANTNRCSFDLQHVGVSEEDVLIYDSYRVKARALFAGLCSLRKDLCQGFWGIPNDLPGDPQKYGALFKNRKSVDVEEYYQAYFAVNPREIYENYRKVDRPYLLKIRKIETLEDVQDEMNEIIEGMQISQNRVAFYLKP